MERAARFAHDDTPQAKLDKLDALLAHAAWSVEPDRTFRTARDLIGRNT
jgi:hypothetical protein